MLQKEKYQQVYVLFVVMAKYIKFLNKFLLVYFKILNEHLSMYLLKYLIKTTYFLRDNFWKADEGAFLVLSSSKCLNQTLHSINDNFNNCGFIFSFY